MGDPSQLLSGLFSMVKALLPGIAEEKTGIPVYLLLSQRPKFGVPVSTYSFRVSPISAESLSGFLFYVVGIIYSYLLFQFGA